MEEINIGSEKFAVIKVLGEGRYGKVYKVRYNDQDKALKIIESDGGGIVSLRELDILSRLCHPYLSKSGAIFIYFQSQFMITDYAMIMDAADEDMWKALQDINWSLESKIKSLFQATNGLQFLHSKADGSFFAFNFLKQKGQ